MKTALTKVMTLAYCHTVYDITKTSAEVITVRVGFFCFPRLPDFFVTPDLGPKMYNAYGTVLKFGIFMSTIVQLPFV